MDRVDETVDMLQAAVSANTIVEIRKVKAFLLQFHGQRVSKHDAENFLDDIIFVNFEADTYCPQVGTELVTFYSKLATYCTDAEINLEAIRQFQLTLVKFDKNWEQQEVQLVAYTLHEICNTFKKYSTVHQSACALLKEMSRNKALVSKKLHSIPLELLKDVQKGGFKRGKDDVDYQGKSSGSVQGGGEIGETDGVELSDMLADYVDYMVELAEAGDEEVLQLESQLVDIGCEPNIV